MVDSFQYKQNITLRKKNMTRNEIKIFNYAKILPEQQFDIFGHHLVLNQDCFPQNPGHRQTYNPAF